MRVNTRKAFEAFLSRKSAKPAALIWTNGSDLYSYGTRIASWEGENVVAFNVRSYSMTTTTHQNALRAAFQQAGVTLNEYDPKD